MLELLLKRINQFPVQINTSVIGGKIVEIQENAFPLPRLRDGECTLIPVRRCARTAGNDKAFQLPVLLSVMFEIRGTAAARNPRIELLLRENRRIGTTVVLVNPPQTVQGNCLADALADVLGIVKAPELFFKRRLRFALQRSEFGFAGSAETIVTSSTVRTDSSPPHPPGISSIP